MCRSLAQSRYIFASSEFYTVYNMNNKDLYNAARGYFTANAVAGSIASELAASNRQQAMEIARITSFYAHYLTEKQISDKVGYYLFCKNVGAAYEFLNNSLKAELIHDCQNQKEFKTHLSELIEQRKDKYRPFYYKIERAMPDFIEHLTAEELCSIMNVDLMTQEAVRQYHIEKKEQESAEKLAENLGLAFRVVLITGLVILMIYLSAQ